MRLFRKIRQLFCTHWYGENKNEFGYKATPWAKLTCDKCGHHLYVDRESIKDI